MTAVLQTLRAVILAILARAELVAENLVLRQQVIVLRRGVVRPRIRPFDRWLISTLAGRFRALVDAHRPREAGDPHRLAPGRLAVVLAVALPLWPPFWSASHRC